MHIQGKTTKLGIEHYNALSDLLKGQRNRVRALEGLIDVLIEAANENKYIIYDLLNEPHLLEIRYRKKK